MGAPELLRLGGLGECLELPQRGPGRSPGRKQLLAYFDLKSVTKNVSKFHFKIHLS